MQLVPEERLARADAAFDAARPRLSPPYNPALLDEPLAGHCLRYYLLLTELPELLGGEELAAEDRFWSRYYWFVRYLKLRQAVAGEDAGLEQQAFQILEHPHPECDPDWTLLQEIEERAIWDAEVQLAAGPE